MSFILLSSAATRELASLKLFSLATFSSSRARNLSWVDEADPAVPPAVLAALVSPLDNFNMSWLDAAGEALSSTVLVIAPLTDCLPPSGVAGAASVD